MQLNPKEEDLTLVVSGHGVADYAAWLKVFSDACTAPSDRNIHRNVLQAKYHLAAQQKNPKQETDKDCCLVVGVTSAAADETIKQTMKYEGEPFTTFIKEGTMIPPFMPNTMGRLVIDRWDIPMDKIAPEIESNPQDFMVYLASHGVPSFDKWYTEAFGGGAPVPEEIKDNLGFVRTLVAKGPLRMIGDDDDSKTDEMQETCIIVHIFRKSCYQAFAKMAKYDAPPFVGGPDFIGKGLVISPFDINLFAYVSFSFSY